jgi:hypothetical protein
MFLQNGHAKWRRGHEAAAYSIIDIQLGHTVQQGHVAWISIMETWTWSTDVKCRHAALTMGMDTQDKSA